MTPLRIGIVGYGFMGRTHSNAYKRLNDFFPVQRQPVLQAVAARDRSKAEAFATNWGYQRIETD
jgi:predicted dehydrogenase